MSQPSADRPRHDASLTIRRCGDSAFLVELDSLDQVLALHAQLTADPLPGLRDVLAAASTVLVQATSPEAAATLAEHIASLPLDATVDRDDTLIDIDVVYDGEDLAEAAQLLGMSTEALITAHTSQTWTAAFGGFAPGFTYCIGENHQLDIARKSTPRTAVPAGSVAIAGQFSAVYPRTTPGGWQLLGHTTEVMWQSERDKPALVAPGNRVRYRAARELVELNTAQAPQQETVDSGLLVNRPGLQTLITDSGRPGFADLGVAESGATDRRSAALANELVGNARIDALLENLYGGLQVTAIGDQLVAVCGAEAELSVRPPATASGQGPADEKSSPASVEEQPETTGFDAPSSLPFILRDGHSLTIGETTRGLRVYLAVCGGIQVPRVLGSAATDLLSGEGPRPITSGQQLAVNTTAWPSVVPGQAGNELPGPHHTVRITLGPRDDWFSPDQIQSLVSQSWTVSDRSNRIGLRLTGTPLKRSHQGELTSEGTVAGAIQIPADGLPVVFMRDHPVTGGYPVIGVVHSADLDGLGQLPPGATLRFTLDDGS